MGERTRTLHLHMPRLGMGLPTKTVRPFARLGDALLEGFLAALAEPVDAVRITGSLFDRPAPAAHLVDRVVSPLGDLIGRGVRVTVPAGTPRSLLFLAAGVRFVPRADPNGTPEFWKAGEYSVSDGERCERRRVEVPRARRAKIDVTGLGTEKVLKLIRSRLFRARGARYVHLTLVGETAEREVLELGPRELHHLLPGGMPGSLENEVISLCPPEDVAVAEGQRKAALARVRAALPDLPEATGIYEFRDAAGRALYVGKAVNLKRRVASHFTAEAREPSPRGPMLLAAHTVWHREHPSEVEALLAEATRIREARPPYNRQMREPESYRYLRADPDAEVPELGSADRAKRDGSLYLGPFPKRWLVERSLRVLMVVYGLKSCDWRPGEDPPVVCTDRDLGICSSPCTGRASLGEYRRRLKMALDHVTGRGRAEPPFGRLNSPAAGLLSTEDLRIFGSFLRSARWFLTALREASGLVPLADGRRLLVLGGLRAGLRDFGRSGDAQAEAWARRRIERFRKLPARSWVRPDQADEVRILSSALRRGNGASRVGDDCGMDSAP